MILVTAKETGLPAYLWIKEIKSMEQHRGSSPYTRVFLQDDRQHHAYSLDVLESETEIKKRIKYNRLVPGGESKHVGKSSDKQEY